MSGTLYFRLVYGKNLKFMHDKIRDLVIQITPLVNKIEGFPHLIQVQALSELRDRYPRYSRFSEVGKRQGQHTRSPSINGQFIGTVCADWNRP